MTHFRVNDEGIAGPHGFKDRRVRLSAKPLAKEIVYGPRGPKNILNPLYTTGGLLFPYTPMINDTTTVNYESYDPIHTNQPFSAFKSVAAKEFSIIGTFTAMNQDEARYCLAAIHFLRTVTKMYFGVGGTDKAGRDLRGTPPPVLLLNGYGTAMYHNIPVIVTMTTFELPQDGDYVKVDTSNLGSRKQTITESGHQASVINSSLDISAWVPTRFTVTVGVRVQNTPDRLRRHFNLNDFRTGNLIKRGGWI